MSDISLFRFWAKVDICPSDCWLWKGGLTSGGYGLFWFRGRSVSAHRFSYETFVGPIPESLQIDHLCRTRNCVNPAHMEPVTTRENVLRGVGITAQNVKKTHCSKGHVFDFEENGKRRCRECYRQKALRQYYKRPLETVTCITCCKPFQRVLRPKNKMDHPCCSPTCRVAFRWERV